MKTIGHGSERMQWLSGLEASHTPVKMIGIEHMSAMKFIVAIMLLLTAMLRECGFKKVWENEQEYGLLSYWTLVWGTYSLATYNKNDDFTNDWIWVFYFLLFLDD